MPPGKDLLGIDVGKSLSDDEQFAHPLTRAVIEQGLTVTPVRLNKTANSMIIGLAIIGNGFELRYRLVDQKTVFIISYRAITCGKGEKGLANPFTGFNWFLENAVQPALGIRRMIGFVHSSVLDGKGISTDRLTRFFHRHINRTIVRQD